MHENSVNEPMTQPSDNLNRALAKFGARSLSDRVPFLYGLSGIDERRVAVMRARDPGYAR